MKTLISLRDSLIPDKKFWSNFLMISRPRSGPAVAQSEDGVAGVRQGQGGGRGAVKY